MQTNTTPSPFSAHLRVKTIKFKKVSKNRKNIEEKVTLT